MECLVEVRTERACVCAFDAANLPADVDRFDAQADAGRWDALTQDGHAWFARTPGNGTWPVLVRVDEVAGDVDTAFHRGMLAVPSGRLWVCGAEFLARDPSAGGPGTPEGGLARHAMGDCVQLPAGVYRLSVIDHAARIAAAREDRAPSGWRRQAARALEFGGYLAGGIGVASAAWTLYALWLGDTDETWQGVLRQNVPAILAFLVVGWAMLYVGRLLDGFESARVLSAGPVAPEPAYTLVLSRIARAAEA